MNHVSIVQELKTHQEENSNNLKDELKANLMQTLQAFSMTEDSENIDPNLPPYCQPTGYMDHNMMGDQEKMLAAINPRVDPQVAQMQKQIELLQSQLTFLSASKNGGGGFMQNGGTNQDINPKLDNHGKDIVGLVDVVIIGENIAQTKRKDRKTKQPSATE